MDVGLDKDTYWLVAFEPCAAIQTNYSMFNELFLLQFCWCLRADSRGAQARSQLQNSGLLHSLLTAVFPRWQQTEISDGLNPLCKNTHCARGSSLHG